MFQFQMPPVAIIPARFVLEWTPFLRARQLLDILPAMPGCLLVTHQILENRELSGTCRAAEGAGVVT